MGWTCFVWGDGSRSVGSGQGHAFRPLLCGPATGAVGAPHKTGPPHRAFRIVADRARCCRQATRRPIPGRRARRQATRPTPGAEGGGPNPLPRTPNPGLRQDQPDRKPPNTQPTETHRHSGSSERRPVDNQNRCGQPQPGRKDHLPRAPPIYSLPRNPNNPEPAAEACAQPKPLWTTNHHSGTPHKIIRHKRPQYTAYRGTPTNQQQQAQPVDHSRRCGQPSTPATNNQTQRAPKAPSAPPPAPHSPAAAPEAMPPCPDPQLATAIPAAAT
ncbi:hypothetical protein LV75_002434 [Actinokineospora diospyrosa]|uniref:Uncharacterized protein n=1 Tax=Actinokineospora diospyrosa TaxID=103728 RepID=A0ABT1IBB5_9PSEU|nr:hypothetical protein [Actinokineospora diospyrosa]